MGRRYDRPMLLNGASLSNYCGLTQGKRCRPEWRGRALQRIMASEWVTNLWIGKISWALIWEKVEKPDENQENQFPGWRRTAARPPHRPRPRGITHPGPMTER